MKKQKWNEDWLFWEMRESFALLWSIPEEAKEVKLPHDAMLSHRAHEQALLGGNSGYRDGGHFCYAKMLKMGGRVLPKYLLQFDGVYENAAVYVNGNLIVRHPYGYTQFYADITPYLEANKENEIRVVTNNKAASSRWYTGGGIYRDVALFTAEHPVYILPDGIRIKTKTLSVSDNRAEIEISATVQNDTAECAEVRLQFDVNDLCGISTGVVKLDAHSQKEVKMSVEIDNPLIWSEDAPALSVCRSSLFCKDGGDFVPVDACETRFGIRKLGMDPATGFTVNGVPVKLRGGSMHHDNGVIGAVEFKDAACRRIRLMKQAGFNAVRMAHNPASSALLEACDELGMFVMNESFDMWSRNKTDYDYANYFEDWWERDIEAMVASSYNHPSVVMYSLGNEIPEIGIRRGREICRMLKDKVKQLDDTRYTTVAINGVFSVGDIIPEIMRDVLGDMGNKDTSGNVNEFLTLMDQNIDKLVVHDRISERLAKVAELVDISGYNYMIARYEKDVEEYPNRIIVGTETYPPEIGRVWKLVKKHPQIIGDFTWAGWDYIGEAGVGIAAYQFGEGGFGARFPSQLSYVGDLDITGFRRPVSYYREIIFGRRKDPYIVVSDPKHYDDRLIMTPWVLTGGIASWDYPGMEGKPVRIEVYAPGDVVELFRNGRTLGKQQIGLESACKAVYETTYEAGTLRAVSYENGSAIGEYTLETPGSGRKLCAVVEEQLSELTYVELSYRDENGILCQACNENVRVRIDGAQESWLGTGNPKPDTNYTDLETKLWNGRALLVIRKACQNDEVSITVNSNRESLQLML